MRNLAAAARAKDSMLHCVIRCVLLAVSVMLWTRLGPAQTTPSTTDPIAALASLTPQPEVPGGARIVVLDADGKPVPAAIVVFVPMGNDGYNERRLAAVEQFPGDEPAVLAALAAPGTRYAVDERGSTRVPTSVGRVFATHGDRFATAILSNREPANRTLLTLLPCRTCTVAVSHADATAAATVPVGVRGKDGSTFVRTRTATDGSAHLRVLDRPDANLSLQLFIASRAPITALLPTDGQPVRLQLPRVVAVDATLVGEPLPGDDLRWSLEAGEPMLRSEPSESGTRTALFPFVEVGIAARVKVTLDGRDSGSAALEEVRADAENHLDVPLTLPARQLAVRLLDADGSVARRRQVAVRWRYPRGSSSTSRTTNREGWLALDVPTSAREESHLDIDLHESGWQSPVVASASLECKQLAPGRTDHGELRCTALPVALTALVVDADGKPVPGVPLRTQQQSFPSDAQGRFVLRLPAPVPSSVELTIDLPWFFADEERRQRSVPTGEAPIRIAVQRAARIRFAARGLPAANLMQRVMSRFEAQLEPASGDGPKLDIDFNLGNKELLVPAGHWHFVIHEQGREVLRLDNLRTAAGVEAHDPRFMDFDWRAFATLVSVTVQDRDGQPTDACTVWHQIGGSGNGQGPHRGVVYLLLPKEGGNLRVEPWDTQKFPTIALGVVTTDQVVRIGGGAQLRAHLAKLPTLPDGVQLLLRTSDTHDGEPFDAQGNAVVWLPAAGPCTPKLALRQGTQTTFLPIPLAAIDVPAGGVDLPIGASDAVQQTIDKALRLR